MSTALTTRPDTGFLVIDTFDQAIKVAEYVNKSALVPDAYRGKPADIVIAMQYGMELGLSPMQALQSVAVINGKPSIYGDALPAVVMLHPDFEDVDAPEPTGSNPEEWVAPCTVKRRGRAPVTRTFSTADAKAAGLWKKAGPWTNYPKRMLMMRARAFALRDAFPDRMKGLTTVEEAIDITPERVEPAEPRRLSESAPSVAPATTAAQAVAAVDQIDRIEATKAAPSSSPSNGEGAADQHTRGLKVLKTEWVEDDKGGFGEITTTRGVFCTRDDGLFSEVGSFEGTDHLAAFTWRHAKRTKKNNEQVRIQLVTTVALDEDATEQGTLPTEGA
jgi:hypothetical protein